MGLRLGVGNGDDQPPVLHPLQADQASGEFFDLCGFATDHKDFEARVMVEMRMTRGDDQFVVGVLDFGQLFGHPMRVMVEDEGDCADYDRVGIRRPIGDQAIPDEIAEGLGSAGIAQPRDENIKPFEKIRIECNSDSA